MGKFKNKNPQSGFQVHPFWAHTTLYLVVLIPTYIYPLYPVPRQQENESNLPMIFSIHNP